MRLIDADELLKDKVSNAYVSRFEIELAPSIDAEPVVHAHWKMKIVKTGYWYECSNCGSHWSINGKTHECEQTLYCSHCGAKMDEEVEQE